MTSLREIAGRTEATPEAALGLHEAQMRRWLLRLLGDVQDAEDAYREACVRVLRFFHQRREEGPEALQAWLFTIARREGYRALRRRALERGRVRRLETQEEGHLAATGPGPSTSIRERQLDQRARALLQALLAELRPRDAALVTLRFQEGLSHRQIAERLSHASRPVKEAAVRKRLSRVIQGLRVSAEAAGLQTLVPG